ncbi:hypothetical protein RRG08_054708 [Elysia crispata]|uniref:Uncharacterized protein n=1 Tax=Elysia crispata TaxID=231223 RepID=A0AAE1B109_9GAST|nr:hypothetical protein RRG08_054708 [Elysia crispata]
MQHREQNSAIPFQNGDKRPGRPQSTHAHRPYPVESSLHSSHFTRLGCGRCYAMIAPTGALDISGLYACNGNSSVLNGKQTMGCVIVTVLAISRIKGCNLCVGRKSGEGR